MVLEELRRTGGQKRVVDGDCGVGGGGRHDVVGLLVPQYRAERRAAVAARGLVGLSELQRSDLHGSAAPRKLGFGFYGFPGLFVV